MTTEKAGVKGSDVFCSVSISDGIFYKTKHTMVVADIAPVVYGHTLIIPTRHVLDITELTGEELLDLFNAIKKVKPVILGLYGDGTGSYDLTSQIGEYSGMSVRHLHIHLIPRKKNDEYQDGSGKSVYDAIEHVKRLSKDEYAKRVAVLRKELKWNP